MSCCCAARSRTAPVSFGPARSRLRRPILCQELFGDSGRRRVIVSSAPCGCGQVGGYPWFLTFNALDELLPRAEPAGPRLLLRSATLGVCAAAVSDCLSNSIRVVKTTRQTAEAPLSYEEAAELVLRQDGLRGLLCRGLGTRLLANIVQAALFTVIWKQLEAGMRGRGLA
mmetsp:Transcript_46743/g.148295  ORF Transcript_46743/g.148295 Transcript_46743/m.148295 type:complete len:170 (+) Transcript_46743:718-1227(+)